ncbi:MAG: chromate efflux transporter [Actinomycetota bacterium]
MAVRRGGVSEIGRYFLKLGVVGFGGPNAHIAAMHDDLVRRRGWVEERYFLDVVGVTNLIPGPNSSEVAIHLGYLRAGLLGGLTAGLSFMFPALLMMLALSWAYFSLGDFAVRQELLAGIQPVALAVVLATLWRLRSGVIGGWRKPILALAGVGLTLVFPRALPLIVIGAGLVSLAASRADGTLRSVLWLPVGLLAGSAVPGGGLLAVAWVFLRTGLLLFGGGLVLVALLGPEVVARGWLTEQQFLDGIALGQATPGPITLTSVFVGYAVHGTVGALVATGAIYLPSFVAVLVGTGPFMRRFRENPSVAAFVEGITAASLGAVLAESALLGRTALAGGVRVAIFSLGLAAVLARVPVVWVVLGGALLGVAAGAAGLL